MGVVAELTQIYGQVHRCHECPKMHREKVRRRVAAVPEACDVFIVSQAPAKNTQRVSGVPYFQSDGHLSRTGARLEAFLRQLGRTLYPPVDIPLKSPYKIAAKPPSLRSVYHSDIVQCYPGPSSYRPGDRKPSLTESTTCLARGYLLRELLTVRPRVVLLMGNAARTAFFRYILFERCRDSLGKHIARIRKSRALPRVTIAQVEVALAPIYLIADFLRQRVTGGAVGVRKDRVNRLPALFDRNDLEELLVGQVGPEPLDPVSPVLAGNVLGGDPRNEAFRGQLCGRRTRVWDGVGEVTHFEEEVDNPDDPVVDNFLDLHMADRVVDELALVFRDLQIVAGGEIEYGGLGPKCLEIDDQVTVDEFPPVAVLQHVAFRQGQRAEDVRLVEGPGIRTKKGKCFGGHDPALHGLSKEGGRLSYSETDPP